MQELKVDIGAFGYQKTIAFSFQRVHLDFTAECGIEKKSKNFRLENTSI
jgi:hypothetical protein